MFSVQPEVSFFLGKLLFKIYKDMNIMDYESRKYKYMCIFVGFLYCKNEMSNWIQLFFPTLELLSRGFDVMSDFCSRKEGKKNTWKPERSTKKS